MMASGMAVVIFIFGASAALAQAAASAQPTTSPGIAVAVNFMSSFPSGLAAVPAGMDCCTQTSPGRG
jgi:hypothetical protein